MTRGESEGFILDKPDQIKAFMYLQWYFALKLEINTGLRHSGGSVMNLIRTAFDIKSRKKVEVLEQYGKILRDAGILQ